jgi:hypothetical protein
MWMEVRGRQQDIDGALASQGGRSSPRDISGSLAMVYELSDTVLEGK